MALGPFLNDYIPLMRIRCTLREMQHIWLSLVIRVSKIPVRIALWQPLFLQQTLDTSTTNTSRLSKSASMIQVSIVC